MRGFVIRIKIKIYKIKLDQQQRNNNKCSSHENFLLFLLLLLLNFIYINQNYTII